MSGSRLARTLTLVQWSQMGSLLQRYFWAPSHTIASSRPGGSDRQVLEERGCLFSHAHKEDSLSPLPPSSSSTSSTLLLTLFESWWHRRLKHWRAPAIHWTRLWFRFC